MKYTLHQPCTWNGQQALPAEINVIHSHPQMAEFELLSMICALHGYVSAFDILTGAEQGSEKDIDLSAVQEAFQAYLFPKMPLSHYSGSDKRNKPIDKKRNPIES
jgi:hypothetical protein